LCIDQHPTTFAAQDVHVVCALLGFLEKIKISSK
jgi:hypothetical protein